MIEIVTPRGGNRRTLSLAVSAAVLAAFLAAASPARATPITYTGFTITDGSLGGWQFHRARVYLTFKGDTNDVQFIQPPIDGVDPANGTVDAYIIGNGDAWIRIETGNRSVRARFDPGQIFVSLDLGDTPLPGDPGHIGARGVGFGSFSASAPGGLEVSYPLGLEDGTLDWGDIPENGGTASDELQSLPIDLVSDVAFSGRAWICPGFPDWTCPPATYALTTNRGDLYLSQPYQGIDFADGGFPQDVISGGFFTSDTSGRRDDDDGLPSSGDPWGHWFDSPITYTATTLTDVQLGRRSFTNAQVYLQLQADASNVVPLDGVTGWVNDVGRARVSIVQGGRTYTADVLPGQLYVYLDITHAQAGFGSYAGGLGYPLGITANTGSFHGLTDNNTLGAVADLTVNPGNSVNYTSATLTLLTDLTNATVLTGTASSCLDLDPATSGCGNQTPVAIHTTRGDLLIYEPYTDLGDGTDPTWKPVSVNWAIFWAEPGSPRHVAHEREHDD